MQAHWSLQDAKNKFSEVVNAACMGTPQIVTKRGTPAVVVLSSALYEQLLQERMPSPPSFADLLLAMPQAEDDAFIDSVGDALDQLQLREVEF